MYLYCTESVEKVRVVPHAGPHPPAVMLALLDKLQDLLLVHAVQLLHQVHRSQSPVHTTHPQVLCYTVLLHTDIQWKISQTHAPNTIYSDLYSMSTILWRFKEVPYKK